VEDRALLASTLSATAVPWQGQRRSLGGVALLLYPAMGRKRQMPGRVPKRDLSRLGSRSGGSAPGDSGVRNLPVRKNRMSRNFYGVFGFCTTYRSRQTSIRIGRAARGGGPPRCAGSGTLRVGVPSEAPLFVHRRDAMISPQRHRDHRGNSQFIAGDSLASALCPPPTRGQALCASVVKIRAKQSQRTVAGSR